MIVFISIQSRIAMLTTHPCIDYSCARWVSDHYMSADARDYLFINDAALAGKENRILTFIRESHPLSHFVSLCFNAVQLMEHMQRGLTVRHPF